ncbi:hypothetical protein Nepgr_015248 [Nepenthes gracilis]|uniref:Uncharacterized protein n=1 Tax=Nepenthes gracilis TaxID=150966 RepID=A0AAD3XQ88_NEPGR|nr:hypothetical protein Nepgr_015248 [Nepenthes gracilis]
MRQELVRAVPYADVTMQIQTSLGFEINMVTSGPTKRNSMLFKRNSIMIQYLECFVRMSLKRAYEGASHLRMAPRKSFIEGFI